MATNPEDKKKKKTFAANPEEKEGFYGKGETPLFEENTEEQEVKPATPPSSPAPEAPAADPDATLAGQVGAVYNQAVKSQKESTDSYTDQMRQAGEQYVSALGTANAVQQQANETALNKFQEALKASDANMATFLTDYDERLRKAQEQGEALNAAAANAARWTGLGELAAAFANLIGVTKGGVSQQIPTVSQDWMQRADAQMREHRSRMDNLRDRQQALRMNIEQMRRGDAQTALELALKQAGLNAQNAKEVAQATYNNDAGIAKAAYEGEGAVNNIALRGGVAQVEAAHTEKQEEKADAVRQQERADALALKGLKLDKKGNITVDPESKVYEFITNVRRSGEGSGNSRKSDYFYTDAEGNKHQFSMSSDEYRSFIRRAGDALAKEDSGFKKLWESMFNDSGKDMAKEGYILGALDTSETLQNLVKQYETGSASAKPSRQNDDEDEYEVSGADDWDKDNR